MEKRKLTRRDFLNLSAGVAAGSLLAACGAQPTPEKIVETVIVEKEGEKVVETVVVEKEVEKVVTATPGAEAPAAETVTITFTGWGGTEEDEGVKSAVKVFEEENPNIKVTWIQIPENYDDKVLAMTAAGTPPDTAFVNNGQFRTYARDGLLLDITDLLKGDPELGRVDYFIEPQEEARCTYQGRWYGIGSCWVAPHIYYNADIFEQEGIEPPSNDPEKAWDWSEFLEVAKQLTIDVNGNHPGDSGFDEDNIERWAIQWPTWSIPLHAVIASNGGYWINPDTGLVDIDKPEATEALQAVADLMLVHKVSPLNTAFSALGMSNTQMLENGKLAMAVDGSWALAWITKINAKLGTAALPKLKQPATDMQAHIHSAYAATKYPDQAWKWVRFLGTEFYQLVFLKMGLWLPSQTDLMTPEGMQKWYTERQGPGDGVHPAGYDQIVTQYVPKYGHVLYMPPGYAKADAVITPALDAIWIGEQTAEEAMTAAAPEANAILEAEQQKG
ncbi:MAG: extracellular solute-binding protein [Anaerolineae bacterium]|nr:extracellular solute-binding protein [Anaerolineae bacterium]